MAISTIGHQGGRPVAVLSSTLNSNETHNCSIEKEAAPPLLKEPETGLTFRAALYPDQEPKLGHRYVLS